VTIIKPVKKLPIITETKGLLLSSQNPINELYPKQL